ncbi:endochitinase 2 [Penicillium riverlandense]|uniref:endochitinase 2 n=1 Tax=Penicillium riverlandense TaxID=1903569 RepID=UPI002548994C|nr:endochitinase 2 [Penicillium riverlandense]KAJ5833357.1 endochitinase 2 [Penicillium riverlandense]
MKYSAILAGLGLLATCASAVPHRIRHYPRADSGAQNVVYWGQNGGGVEENNDLASYCNGTSGIDILVLAFLYQYGNGNDIASGIIGQSCSISGGTGEPSQCDALASAIKTCQSAGIKIILSLGGAVGAYSLQSQQEAETIGQNLWDAYGNSGNGTVPRPFGDVYVNGWDFDIEASSGNQYYQYMISTLRSNFASDSANTYYITGAPQCPIPEPNMQEIITNSQFDYLWVQFYNNPGCSVNGVINYDAWVANVANTPSANAKIFIGVPAAPDGATGSSSGAQYYLEPSALATLVGNYSSNPHFGGIMMWAAAFSDSNVNNGCTYAQEAHSILTTGSPC